MSNITSFKHCNSLLHILILYLAFKPFNRKLFLSKKLDFGPQSPEKDKFDINARRQTQPETKTQPIKNFDYTQSTKDPGTIALQTIDINEITEFMKDERNNIFAEVNNSERKKYVDCNIGPKFDSEGSIVKWSILGKAEQFQRVQNSKKKIVSTQIASNPNTSIMMKKSTISKLMKNDMSKIIQEDDSQGAGSAIQLKREQTITSLGHQQSMSQDPIKASNKLGFQKNQSKKHRSEYKLVAKDELFSMMKNIERRIDENTNKQEEREEALSINLKNIVTREKRIIEKFEDQTDTWEAKRNELSAHCNRNPRDTIFSRSSQYRIKIENAKGVELTKTDQEKYNNRFWYLRLRSYDQILKNPLKTGHLQSTNNLEQKTKKAEKRNEFDLVTSIHHRLTPQYQSRLQDRFIKDEEGEKLYRKKEYTLSDIFSGFNTKIVDNPYQQVEIVRNPNVQNDEKDRLFSQQFKRIYQQRIDQFPEKTRGKYIKINEEDTQNLKLEGQNIFYKEFNNLRNDGQPNVAQYIKHEIDKYPDYQQEEANKGKKKSTEIEVIAENWDSRMLSKTGEHIFPQWIKLQQIQ